MTRKAVVKFTKLHGGREFRLTLFGLSAVVSGIAMFAPHMTFECGMIGFCLNTMWIYGSQ